MKYFAVYLLLVGVPAAGLAAIVHAADVSGALDSDPLGPGLLAIGEGGLDAEQDDHRLLERGVFVYDALYAWSARHPGDGTGAAERGRPCSGPLSAMRATVGRARRRSPKGRVCCPV